jgi:hypothetical protein
MRIGWLVNAEHFVTTTPFPNCGIYQPPNAHVQISGILLSNAMAAAVKKIYCSEVAMSREKCRQNFLIPLTME